MDKFAIVILNYLNWKDTLECVNSIQEQSWGKNIKIYVVDNGSNNDSVKNLKQYQDKYELIISNINLGFAKGNNLGIKKAVKDGYEFVIVSNPDIVFKKDDNFLDKVINIYNIDNKIALISPKILEDKKVAQPFAYHPFSFSKKLKTIFFYLTFFYKIYYFIRVYVLFDFITKMAVSKNVHNHQSIRNTQVLSSYVYASQGAFIILTPTFFQYFNGFFEKTFLFCEEYILAEMIFQKKLKEYFFVDIVVEHKGSTTINSVMKSYKNKVKFVLKHTFSSCKYYALFLLRGLFR